MREMELRSKERKIIVTGTTTGETCCCVKDSLKLAWAEGGRLEVWKCIFLKKISKGK